MRIYISTRDACVVGYHLIFAFRGRFPDLESTIDRIQTKVTQTQSDRKSVPIKTSGVVSHGTPSPAKNFWWSHERRSTVFQPPIPGSENLLLRQDGRFA